MPGNNQIREGNGEQGGIQFAFGAQPNFDLLQTVPDLLLNTFSIKHIRYTDQ